MYLLLDVLADLVVHLELLLELLEVVILKVSTLDLLFSRGNGRVEEVEERVGRLGLAHQTGSVGSCNVAISTLEKRNP